MIQKIKFTFLALVATIGVKAQTNPAYTSFLQNTTTLGTTQGTSNGILTNCQGVYYDATYSYIKSSSMPAYDIGPWSANPNTPSNQNKTWKLPLAPVENSGTKTTTALGAIGIWINGVEIFNQKDGKYWNGSAFTNGQGANWNRNALYYEGVSFDACLGHPAPGGVYHIHVNPTCLYDDQNTSTHSPIVGFAFDGFPIYGAYAYTNTNGTGAIKRMVSSYVLNTTRIGTPTPPPVNTTYPLGCLCEDYTYTSGAGDLDAYNGRFCITPEYPSGTYAYFITIDASGNPAYPFILGNQYYGTVPAGVFGSSTIPINATQYIQFPLGLNDINLGLNKFTAYSDNNNVIVKWTTEFENNLNNFIIEKSKNGSKWETVTTVNATNKSMSASYEETDFTPFNGISYYRLGAVDIDKKVSYSEIQRVNLDNLFDDLSVYPNPINNVLNFSSLRNYYSYSIKNCVGQVVASGIIKGQTSVNTENLVNGLYIVDITNPITEITKSRKIIKQN